MAQKTIEEVTFFECTQFRNISKRQKTFEYYSLQLLYIFNIAFSCILNFKLWKMIFQKRTSLSFECSFNVKLGSRFFSRLTSSIARFAAGMHACEKTKNEIFFSLTTAKKNATFAANFVWTKSEVDEKNSRGFNEKRGNMVQVGEIEQWSCERTSVN